MTSRRKFLNFTTPLGVELSSVAQAGWGSAFLVHECGFSEAIQDWNHSGVDSPFWRLYHNPSPGCHIRHAGVDIALEPGHVLLIPANTVFDCCMSRSCAHFWIHFSMAGHTASPLSSPTRVAVDRVIAPLLREATSIHGEAPSDQRDQRLFHLSKGLLHLAFSRLPMPDLQRVPAALGRILQLIHQAPHADLSNPALARHAGMSVERFIRWFRAQMGRSPAAYMSDSRIHHAKEALSLSDKTIDQIADQLGLPNRHYFSRVFAKKVGCGPAEFRDRQRRRRGI